MKLQLFPENPDWLALVRNTARHFLKCVVSRNLEEMKRDRGFRQNGFRQNLDFGSNMILAEWILAEWI
jgi:hypothetical protein